MKKQFFTILGVLLLVGLIASCDDLYPLEEKAAFRLPLGSRVLGKGLWKLQKVSHL